MLSRKTRSQIIELIETVRGGLVCQNSDERAAMLDECIAALSVAYEIIQKELSHERFAQYDDTITTVKAALMQLKENPDSEEIAALSLQLIDWLLGQLKNEPVKKEIVFLPYKASMWDSLESIWKAAYEDKEYCNTYVIPIPYADLVRDEQGQLAVHSWHCEIDEMPDYVPVIDNETVNLEEMHPDVIFIHNPYDNTNYVTSVDMRYYSSELKKYTDKLIYVPYFVVGGSFDPAFATKPGVVNADCVIVQDERVKTLYEANYPGGNPPKGKFLPLGSPKFDKVLFGKREDYTLPKEWQKIINGKKVVLYNTSVATALRYTDKICDKLRFVFQSFKGRADVALWWRPHPLMESTLRSMRPEVLAEYESLKEEYIRNGWGIYDDTADLDRAIICSDMYYGDPSSVVELYKITGKPVLYQEMEYIEPAEPFDVPVWTQAMCSDGESLWFVEGKINLLMQYHIKSNRLICRGFIPKESCMQEYAYGAIAYADGKVFMFPSYANYIHVYDIEKDAFFDLDYPEREKFNNVCKFQGVYVYKDALYCVPYEYGYFLRIQLSSMNVEAVGNAKALYRQAGLLPTQFIMSSDWYDEGIVAALIYRTNKIICWQLLDNVFEIKEFLNTEQKYGCIAVTPKTVYLAGRVVGDVTSVAYADVFNRVSCEKIMRIAEGLPAVRSLGKNRVVLWNTDFGNWVIMNTDDNSVLYEGGMNSRPSGALQFFYHTFICCQDKVSYYGFSCHDNMFFFFNEKGEICNSVKLYLNMAENLPALDALLKPGVFFEMPGFLEALLKFKDKKAEMTANDAVGRNIYEAVCKLWG